METYDVTVNFKEGDSLSFKCMYDGFNECFYYFVVDDESQYQIPISSIKFIYFSPNRAIQIEIRRKMEEEQKKAEA
jgi:hypothetical protein